MSAKIGQDISWTNVIRRVFGILEFDRAGTIIRAGNKVKARSMFKPYGHLLVEAPFPKNFGENRNRKIACAYQQAWLPIVHRDDFLLAASAFDDPTIMAAIENEAELLVTYVPKHDMLGGRAGATHALHYVLCPTGTLDRYYGVTVTHDNMYMDAIHIDSPSPEKLFGHFIWEGVVSVGVNETPSV